jgi:tetratricopeptide (TPR) repeat protein
LPAVAAALAGVLGVGAAAAGEPADAAAAQAVHGAHAAANAGLQARLLAAANERPDDFEAQIAAAELLLDFANHLRNERKIRSDLPDDQDDAYRQQQADWAEQALPRAERALELAADDAQQAHAERVLGELYAHRITGMISGMINGPRARRHIGRALELAPDDPEAQRAIGLMYLHNPPISGGDLPKAVETFERCAESLPDERCLVLLAMAHRKRDDLVAARVAAQAALARDPESAEAKLLLEELPEGPM